MGGVPLFPALRSPMIRSQSTIVVIAFALVASTGCAMGGMRWSSPATRGHGRVAIVPEMRHDTEGGTIPDLSVEYRRGMTDTFDLGGRVFALGGALDGRYLLRRSEDAEVSLGAGFSASSPRVYLPSAHAGYELAFDPQVRVGVNISRKSQLAVGIIPSLVYVREDLEPLHKNGIMFVPTATLAFDLGFSDSFHVVPEVSASSFVGSDSFRATDDTVRLRAALGFYF